MKEKEVPPLSGQPFSSVHQISDDCLLLSGATLQSQFNPASSSASAPLYSALDRVSLDAEKMSPARTRTAAAKQKVLDAHRDCVAGGVDMIQGLVDNEWLQSSGGTLALLHKASQSEYGWQFIDGCHVQFTRSLRAHRLPRRGIDRTAFPTRSTFIGNSLTSEAMSWTCVEHHVDYQALDAPQAFVHGKCEVMATVFHPLQPPSQMPAAPIREISPEDSTDGFAVPDADDWEELLRTLHSTDHVPSHAAAAARPSAHRQIVISSILHFTKALSLGRYIVSPTLSEILCAKNLILNSPLVSAMRLSKPEGLACCLALFAPALILTVRPHQCWRKTQPPCQSWSTNHCCSRLQARPRHT